MATTPDLLTPPSFQTYLPARVCAHRWPVRIGRRESAAAAVWCSWGASPRPLPTTLRTAPAFRPAKDGFPGGSVIDVAAAAAADRGSPPVGLLLSSANPARDRGQPVRPCTAVRLLEIRFRIRPR
jgi:hypothetical protein